MAKTTKTKETKTTNVLPWAVAGVCVAALLVFLFLGQNPAAPGKTITVNWGMGQGVESEAPEALETELTVYQVSSPSYGYAPLEFNYRAGMGLVKEKRRAALVSGLNLLSVPSLAAHIDPTSVYFKDLTDPDARVLEQDYDYDLASDAKLLQKHVGKTVSVKAGNDTVTGKLLTAGKPLVLETSQGVESFNDFDRIVYPSLPEGLLSTPTINWLLGATKAGEHEFELGYLASGINWRADYVAVSNQDDSAIDLQAWVSIDNKAGVTFKDARLKLVAGDVHLVSGAQQVYRVAQDYAMEVAAAPEPAPQQFVEEGFSEYHLYSLNRTTTLKDNQVKQLTLFEAEGVTSEKELVFQPSRSDKVQVKMVFENSEEGGLGVPLPAGKVRVYKPDSAGQLQFLGEDQLSHTAKDEEVRLFVGNAFDVAAEKNEVDREQLGRCSSQASYEVSVRNHKAEAVTVKFVDDSLWGDWEIVRESLPHEKEDARTAVWTLSAPADGETVLSYTVRTRWC